VSFNSVQIFEEKIADFYGSPYAVAVDCCTHGIELCLRHTNTLHYSVPKRTYISIPMLANKLQITFSWQDLNWQYYYFLGNTNIIDAAVNWKANSYIKNTFMCLSFQFQKHLSLGRGGMILTDSQDSYETLKKMSYDGRLPNTPWREQNINTMGYHYYMTPETANMGIQKLPEAIKRKPRKWQVLDWPDLTQMEIFK